MYCPEHLVFESRFLWVWMYWQDVPREKIPMRVWLTPLNYEISVYSNRRRLFTINREGKAIRAWWRRVKRALSVQP